MTKQKFFLTSVFFALCVFLPLASLPKAEAMQTTFEQRILPLECTISTVQAGGVSATTGNCGSFVPLTPSASPYVPTPFIAQNPGRSLLPGNPASGTSGGGGMARPSNALVYLNDIGKLDKVGGFLLELARGSRVTFRLIQDGSAGVLRGFSVQAVGYHAFVLTVSPDGTVVRVPLHGQQRLDLDGDGIVDVSLRAEYISEDGQIGMLRAVFYTPMLRDQVWHDPTYEIAFIVAFSMLCVGTAHLYHRFIRSPLEHKEWMTHKHHYAY